MEQASDALELRRELAQQIEILRRDFHQIIEKYRVNVEAELINCIDLLSAEHADDVPRSVTDPKQLEFMIQALTAISYKANKGRFKDVRKIHYLVKMLANRLSE